MVSYVQQGWLGIPQTYPTGVTLGGAVPIIGGLSYGLTSTSNTFIPAAAVSASTGVSALETSYSLYGHIIPLSVFGVGRIGGEIIAGPWVENGLASFIISFGVPADPSGTRELREIAFDSNVVWTGSVVGAGPVTTSGFTGEPIAATFYDGTLTQLPDPLETLHFGSEANAYRPQILIAFTNLPLANTKFKKIPYVSAVFADTSGDDVNIGEAFERLAYSPWVGYTSSEFETVGVTDALPDGGLIIVQETEFLQLIQQFGRFYSNWDILQTDKLRVVDRGSDVTADITLDRTRLMGDLSVRLQGPDTSNKDIELSTIDPGADYTIVPFVATRPRDPVPVTTSVKKDAAYLPAIMDSYTRAAVATLALYRGEAQRKTISGTAMAYGLEIEPGALLAITDIGDNFRDEIFKVKETLHGVNNAVEFTAESIFNCEISDPLLGSVVLLMGFEGEDGDNGAPGMTDESPAEHGTISAGSPSAIDTAQSMFGGSSFHLDPGAIVTLFGYHSDWNLSTSNSDEFTVEASCRIASIGSPYACIVSNSFISGVDWDFSVLPTGEFKFRFENNAHATIIVTSSGAGLTTGVWYQLAVDKDSTGKIRLYKDGVMVGSDTPADSSIVDNHDPLVVGSVGAGAAGFDGWIDELRITKGAARYASDSGYAVATAAFPRR